MQGTPAPRDVDGDGKFTVGTDGIRFREIFTAVRPLPGGEYRVDRREVRKLFLLCDNALSTEWTIMVTSPAGTLHEMLFDPVTVGGAVAADATNGVLRPRGFMTAYRTASAISLTAYEPSSAEPGQSGVVKIWVTPHDALSGHVVDFIEMDGTVSLSLDVATASLDGEASTLIWNVAYQPWKVGDRLMVRVRSASSPMQTPTDSPSPVGTLLPPADVQLVRG